MKSFFPLLDYAVVKEQTLSGETSENKIDDCRTTDLHSQAKAVGVTGLEPVTSRLSVVCSSQLSYTPPIADADF